VGDVLMGAAICLWAADSVGGWLYKGRFHKGRSTRSVHREHGRRPGCEVVGDGE
jgi:hypothetical protein